MNKNESLPSRSVLITVFTPTWNRAHLLPRVFDSLMKQSVRNCEWLVYDDGSTDQTGILVEHLSSRADCPVRYVRSNNRGKVAAVNAGADIAQGELFLILDSDDAAAFNAMERFAQVWRAVGRSGLRNKYMGISSLKVDLNGDLIGDDYSQLEGRDASYIDRTSLRIRGGKWEILRTD